jgi:glycosyltransferase involved in cell wall biosynthesis
LKQVDHRADAASNLRAGDARVRTSFDRQADQGRACGRGHQPRLLDLAFGAFGERQASCKSGGVTRETTPAWLDRACILIPAFDAAATIAVVVEGLRASIPERAAAILVVDDGSHDRTAAIAHELGCIVVEHGKNQGKGAALRAGFERAAQRGWTVAVTVDADGQHPPEEARRVLFAPHDEGALVLGVRDLVRDGAPRANRVSNGISNHFISRFARKELHDTQCGLRRYPIQETLALGPRGRGYDFEAEIILRASWAGLTVAEEPIRVLYPEDRSSHFRVARDPWRIVRTVVAALGEQWLSA